MGVVKFLPIFLLSLGACVSEYQEVKIVVDDFRFSPTRVDVRAGQSVHLVVRNQGRETHRFHSTLLAQPRVDVVSDTGPQAASLEQGVPLAPGQRLELVLTVPPGSITFGVPSKGIAGCRA